MEFSVHEAKVQLSQLLRRAVAGEDVVISHAGKPVVRLTPVATERKPRKPGSAKGLVRIADDFNAPLPIEIFG